MSIVDVAKAFNETAQGRASCAGVTAIYVDGGKSQKFVFNIVGRGPVEVIWPGVTNNDAIAKAALDQIAT